MMMMKDKVTQYTDCLACAEKRTRNLPDRTRNTTSISCRRQIRATARCCRPSTVLFIHTSIPFNGPFSGTIRVSRYQKGKTDLDFTEARDSEWQWHQLGHMQVCTSLQTDNHNNWDTHTHKFIQRLWDYVNSCWERRNKQSTEVYVDIKKQSEPGIPTWQSARAESGVSSEGLRTSVQPAATAGAAFLVNIATGKFHCKHTTPVNVQMSWEIHNRLRRNELANVLVETYYYTTTWVSRYQKGKTSLDLYETRDDGVLGWQWHQLDHMQKNLHLAPDR